MPTLSKLTKDAFHSETAAFEYLEATCGPMARFAPIAGPSARPPSCKPTGAARTASGKPG